MVTVGFVLILLLAAATCYGYYTFYFVRADAAARLALVLSQAGLSQDDARFLAFVDLAYVYFLDDVYDMALMAPKTYTSLVRNLDQLVELQFVTATTDNRSKQLVDVAKKLRAEALNGFASMVYGDASGVYQDKLVLETKRLRALLRRTVETIDAQTDAVYKTRRYDLNQPPAYAPFTLFDFFVE